MHGIVNKRFKEQTRNRKCQCLRHYSLACLPTFKQHLLVNVLIERLMMIYIGNDLQPSLTVKVWYTNVNFVIFSRYLDYPLKLRILDPERPPPPSNHTTRLFQEWYVKMARQRHSHKRNRSGRLRFSPRSLLKFKFTFGGKKMKLRRNFIVPVMCRGINKRTYPDRYSVRQFARVRKLRELRERRRRQRRQREVRSRLFFPPFLFSSSCTGLHPNIWSNIFQFS